jgi:hypothetical protein
MSHYTIRRTIHQLERVSKLQPPILINRFLINLRSLDDSGISDAANAQPSLQSMSFRTPDSVLGNFGQPLDHGSEHEDEDFGPHNLSLDDIAAVVGVPEGDLEGKSEGPVAGPSTVRPLELLDVKSVGPLPIRLGCEMS